jgi:hypothetical protein
MIVNGTEAPNGLVLTSMTRDEHFQSFCTFSASEAKVRQGSREWDVEEIASFACSFACSFDQ